MKQEYKFSSDLSSKILTIGPDYRNHRGGVGAVIEVYSRYFEIFNFIPTYKVGSVFFKCYVFILGVTKLVYTLIINRKILIIHIHSASYGSFYRKYIIFIITKYIFRKKTIYHIHGGGFEVFYKKCNALSKRMIKDLLGRTDVVICLSRSWSEYYENNFKIRRLIILPNIIDYPKKTEAVEKNGVITFLFLGLVSEAKGIFDLIEVIAKNKEHYRTRIKLLIGGNGDIQHLKDLIARNNIEDIVEFLGWISSKEKTEVLNYSDVFILPSYNEGLPISIIESMSYGKAVISTNVGGIPEIVLNGKNGLLINPGELDQIAQALDFFLENPELIVEYGAYSEKMIQKHLPHSVIHELIDIYKSALSNE
jgi:glycosyltransferase involved in cell wall biosynthesis